MSNSHSTLWPGVLFALGSAALFGAATPLSKVLLGTIDPQMLAGILYAAAGVGLAAVHIGRAALGIAASEAPLRARDLPWLALVVTCGGIVGPVLLMLGLTRTNAASGSLLLNLESLATMAIAMAALSGKDRSPVNGRSARDRSGRRCAIMAWQWHFP